MGSNMAIEPYRKEHYQGVVECLRRNFKWMGETTPQVVGEWVDPILSYKWLGCTQVLEDEYPYSHGAVLMDNETVVGYFGMIAAKRQIRGESFVCVAPTTWALDEEYRFGFANIINNLLTWDHLFLELTPRDSVELTLKYLYKFRELSTIQYRLLPIPCHKDDLEVKWIDRPDEIQYETIKTEYEDHKGFYGIRLVEFRAASTDQKGYVFYKVYDEADRGIRLLKIDNTGLFANVCHELIWKIYAKEKLEGLSGAEADGLALSNMYDKKRVCVECDEMITDGHELVFPYLKKSKVTRLIRSKQGVVPEDLLYTEMALLSYGL